MEPFSLPDSTHIGGISLKVSDLQKSLAFYSDLLGFRLDQREDYSASLSSGGDQANLIHLTAIRNALPKSHRTTGLYHVAIRLPERPALASLLQRLLESHYPLQGAADHLVSEAIYLADPDSNGLELYIDRPRSLWPVFDDQVQMATDPLDVSGLLAEAHPAGDWTGIHPGTDIGHIHLQVSDLAKAEAFYCGMLGFQVTQRNYPGALFVSAGGYHHHVGLNTWSSRGAPQPPPESVGLDSFQVWIPDAGAHEEVRHRLQAQNLVLGPVDPDTILTSDPDGNRLEIVHTTFTRR